MQSVKPNSAFMLFYERAAELEPLKINPQLADPAATTSTTPTPALAPTPPTSPEPEALKAADGDAMNVSAVLSRSVDMCDLPADASSVDTMPSQPVEESVPWDMPLAIYKRVIHENIVHCLATHLTDPKHANFISSLVSQVSYLFRAYIIIARLSLR